MFPRRDCKVWCKQIHSVESKETAKKGKKGEQKRSKANAGGSVASSDWVFRDEFRVELVRARNEIRA
jgi:hypothetical protein